MEKKINTDLKSLKFIIDRNRSYITPVSIIIICIFLFFQFIIPQFNSLITRRQEAREASEKLETLKSNLNVLTNTNEISLDSQLKTLTLALPLDKDFDGILNAIYFAAQRTGVQIGSFSMAIGNLSEEENNSEFLTIDISVPVNATGFGVNSFVNVLASTVPLSEISLIRIGERAATVKISFYYKPLNTSGENEDTGINPISQEGLTLINKLNEFENILRPATPLQIATSSSQEGF